MQSHRPKKCKACITGLAELQTLVANNQQQANDMVKAASENFANFQKQVTQAATQAATDRATDQAQNKSQFDLLMAAFNDLKSQKRNAPEEQESGSDDNEPTRSKPRKERRKKADDDSESSKSRSRSSQRGGR